MVTLMKWSRLVWEYLRQKSFMWSAPSFVESADYFDAVFGQFFSAVLSLSLSLSSLSLSLFLSQFLSLSLLFLFFFPGACII